MDPVRILQISYDMSLGGAETLLMNLYRNIDRSKVQFDFLLHSETESAYEKEIRDLGGRIFRIPRYTGLNKGSYEKSLRSFLTSHPEYVIVHDHLMYSASETLKVVNRMGRISVAHSHSSCPPFSIEEMIRFFFRRNLWKIADYRFACSEDAGKWLYRGKTDFMILRNGVDVDSFSFKADARIKARKELCIEDSTLLVGTVGRMVSNKNPLRLLSVFSEIISRKPDSKLVMVGTGPLENEIRSRSKAMGLEDKVILTGPRTDVPDLLCAMDRFVLPSEFEGLGIVLIEALSSGLPCIFTDSLPSELNINDKLIHRVSLSSSDSTWAETILNAEPAKTRETAWNSIRDAGYDIKTVSVQLQEFYLTVRKP